MYFTSECEVVRHATCVIPTQGYWIEEVLRLPVHTPGLQQRQVWYT